MNIMISNNYNAKNDKRFIFFIQLGHLSLSTLILLVLISSCKEPNCSQLSPSKVPPLISSQEGEHIHEYLMRMERSMRLAMNSLSDEIRAKEVNRQHPLTFDDVAIQRAKRALSEAKAGKEFFKEAGVLTQDKDESKQLLEEFIKNSTFENWGKTWPKLISNIIGSEAVMNLPAWDLVPQSMMKRRALFFIEDLKRKLIEISCDYTNKSSRNGGALDSSPSSCDANKRNPNQMMHYAYVGNVFCLKDLISEGYTRMDKNDPGRSFLHDFIHRDDINSVEFLLQVGLDVNSVSHLLGSPLVLAEAKKNYKMVELLVEYGAKLDTCVSLSTSPCQSLIAYAVSVDDEKMVKLLLRLGANINYMDNSLGTALHYSAIFGSKDMVQLLIENGSDVLIRNKNNGLPLDMVSIEKGESFVEFFRQKTIENSCLKKVSKENINSILKYISSPLQINNIHDSRGLFPFHIAANSGNIEAVKLLISIGADLNIRDTKDGITPLHLAIIQDQIKIAKFLIEQGANVNIKSNSGITPMHLAIRMNNSELQEILMN